MGKDCYTREKIQKAVEDKGYTSGLMIIVIKDMM